MDEKSVFIGYRRDQVSKGHAWALKLALESHGWDVFLDVDGLDSGEWAEQLTRQIRYRPHFILLLTPGALDRCGSEDDFLRREYEVARKARRNLVPVQGEDYDLRTEKQKCPEPMQKVFDFQIASLRHASFPRDVETLLEKYLSNPGRVAELDEERRAGALVRVRENVGKVLKGTFYDQVEELLADGALSTELREELIDEIEALDGTARMQRALRDFVRELRPESAPSAPAVVTAPKPGPVPPLDPPAGTLWVSPQGFRLRFVPAGIYWIGSPKDEPGRGGAEVRHQVQLTRGFWLGETEVTQGQWQELVRRNPARFAAGGDDNPVEQVSWWEAVAYANLLSEREGLEVCYELVGAKGGRELGTVQFECQEVRFLGLDRNGYRLPTEAEWEVAARAGTETALYTGGITLRGERHAPELHEIAWYGGNSGVSYEGAWDSADWTEMQFPAAKSGTHPVGKKAPNRWGLLDMLGNVKEWVWDWTADYPLGLAVDPVGPAAGSTRVIRGGSWDSTAKLVRAAYRHWFRPSRRSANLGFRLARSQGR